MRLPSNINVSLTNKEYKLISGLVHSSSGIHFGSHKKELVKARLLKRIKLHGFSSFSEYYSYVVKDQSGRELEDLLNALTTNVTSFFREKKHFDYLYQQALPAVIAGKEKSNDKKIRIWSCAAATGEEIYSILITIAENLKLSIDWEIKVLGTDISTRALSVAWEGLYGLRKVGGLTPVLLNKYFQEEIIKKERYYRVKDFLKDKVVFSRFNLAEEIFPFSHTFDIVFCRNVMIYFDKETQSRLIEKLYQYMSEGGYLFIGHSESLIGMKMKFQSAATAVYKKPKRVA